MQDPLANSLWNALLTEHAHVALGAGPARRYPADVIPFAGLEHNGPEALEALRNLLAPDECLYVSTQELASIPGLVEEATIPGLQMHFPPGTAIPEAPAASPIEPLGAAEASAMVHLTDVAFPGYFRPRTYLLGRYFGIRSEGELVAMAGERIAVPGAREISAVCTHPQHTGKGYAAQLIQHLLRLHAAEGMHSFLHLAAANTRAHALYQRLGFRETRTTFFRRMRRIETV